MKSGSTLTPRKVLPPAVAALAVAVGVLLPLFFNQPFFFYAGYVVLQFVVLSYAWDIFGSHAGYINFGTAGFFGVGVYVSGYLYHNYDVGLGLGLLCAGLSSAALGAAVGFATVRLRGLYFAIVTLAMSFVIQAVIINSPALGESYGLLVTQPPAPHPFPSYVAFLFSVMVAMAAAVALTSWAIKRSRFGSGLA
ncbi:MAG: branched-chain amino acid ABC transporter permease, partial [Nitrososphaerota archaeon]|nr:branched-chain amino acid ABC transporter permease [Nitrososphaerota archaeon]